MANPGARNAVVMASTMVRIRASGFFIVATIALVLALTWFVPQVQAQDDRPPSDREVAPLVAATGSKPLADYTVEELLALPRLRAWEIMNEFTSAEITERFTYAERVQLAPVFLAKADLDSWLETDSAEQPTLAALNTALGRAPVVVEPGGSCFVGPLVP